jgi:uncharacterized protein
VQEILGSFLTNAANPAVLFFLIGLSASLLRVELPFPGSFKVLLTVYLMAAIGFKGGAAVAETGLGAIWLPAVCVAALGALQPVWIYPLARFVGRLSFPDAIAMAAHYSSVSAVTFAAATNQLASAGIPFEGGAPALLAVMEVPGIVVALSMYHWMQARRHGAGASSSIGEAVSAVLRGKSVFVLLASLVAGFLAGKPGLESTAGFFITPFQGMLTLFLLEMGMEAGNRLQELLRAGPFLITFGILLPLAQGALGVLVGTWAGLSPGGAALVGVLSASASYIAAPTAVRVMVPEANPSIYVTSALGITFPFNVVVGIPIYLAIAQRLAG